MRSGRGWPGWVDGVEALCHSKQSSSGLTPMTQTTSVKGWCLNPDSPTCHSPAPPQPFNRHCRPSAGHTQGPCSPCGPVPSPKHSCPVTQVAGQSSVHLTLMSGAPCSHCCLC